MHTTLKPPRTTKGTRGPVSSKNGSIAAAAIAAVLAGLVILVFLGQYRDNVSNDGVPTPVLVAEELIEQGASGDTVGAQGRFKATEVPRDQLKTGAITDAAVLRGQVATADILPGQQLTAADFRSGGRGIITKLAADERAVTISLDSAHGLVGKLAAGNHVDVLSGFMLDNGAGRQRPVLKTLMENVLVLDVPPKASGSAVTATTNATAEVTLRTAASAAAKLAFAADNGKLWLVLRPQNGRSAEKTPLVTLQSLLADTKAIDVSAEAQR